MERERVTIISQINNLDSLSWASYLVMDSVMQKHLNLQIFSRDDIVTPNYLLIPQHPNVKHVYYMYTTSTDIMVISEVSVPFLQDEERGREGEKRREGEREKEKEREMGLKRERVKEFVSALEYASAYDLQIDCQGSSHHKFSFSPSLSLHILSSLSSSLVPVFHLQTLTLSYTHIQRTHNAHTYTHTLTLFLSDSPALYRYFFTPNDVSMGGSGALLLSLSLGFRRSLSFISQEQTKNIQNQKYLYYLGLLLSHLLSLRSLTLTHTQTHTHIRTHPYTYTHTHTSVQFHAQLSLSLTLRSQPRRW